MKINLTLVFVFLFFFGCSGITWNKRVGTYTYEQAVNDYGPPEYKEKLSNGNTVYNWITSQDLTWIEKTFLTFSEEGRLVSWEKKGFVKEIYKE